MESIDNVALVIPIHPPHYQFLYDVLHKLKDNNIQIDIFLIFSSIPDYTNFHMKTDITPIIVFEPLDINPIITLKKFYGLKQLMRSKYEYFIVCDAEIDIIPENFTKTNIHNKITRIFENKKIYAGDVDGSNILMSCANLFPNYYEDLRNITNNFKIFFWWSDLPVYRKADLESFFNMINYDTIGWLHFDHIIYQYYLILKHDFVIVNYTPITNIYGSLEQLDTQTPTILRKLLDIDFGFGWINRKIYDSYPEFVIEQKGFMINHMDRIS